MKSAFALLKLLTIGTCFEHLCLASLHCCIVHFKQYTQSQKYSTLEALVSCVRY